MSQLLEKRGFVRKRDSGESDGGRARPVFDADAATDCRACTAERLKIARASNFPGPCRCLADLHFLSGARGGGRQAGATAARAFSPGQPRNCFRVSPFTFAPVPYALVVSDCYQTALISRLLSEQYYEHAACYRTGFVHSKLFPVFKGENATVCPRPRFLRRIFLSDAFQ